MSETPDVAAEDFVDQDDEPLTTLPEEAPEADEADRQEQAEIVSYDEDDETR